MPTLSVDERTVTVPDGATVLQAVRLAGAPLPTLCHWEGLPPYGACRLCLVAVAQGAGQAQVVAACTQPATEGLQVATQAPQAVALRRLMLEFLLARCPSSGTIRDLAADAGVTATRFVSAASRGRPDELCILCGLCVRVCRDLVGAAAIGFSGRGAGREVDAPFHVQAEACIGCGACAAVCPTGAVQIEDVGGQRFLRTWHTVVPLRPCPGCGQPFGPEPMAFLAGLADASEELWGRCPACRRKAATQAVSAAQPR